MKVLLKLVVVALVFGFISCRDTKKEEEEAAAKVEQIEAIEKEAATLTEELEAEAGELEEALNELDSI